MFHAILQEDTITLVILVLLIMAVGFVIGFRASEVIERRNAKRAERLLANYEATLRASAALNTRMEDRIAGVVEAFRTKNRGRQNGH